MQIAPYPVNVPTSTAVLASSMRARIVSSAA